MTSPVAGGPRRAPLEAKLTIPALVVAILGNLGGGLYGLALAYGLDPTPEQERALVGLGVAVLYVAQLVAGYLAPHTARPDLKQPAPPVVVTYAPPVQRDVAQD